MQKAQILFVGKDNNFSATFAIFVTKNHYPIAFFTQYV